MTLLLAFFSGSSCAGDWVERWQQRREDRRENREHRRAKLMNWLEDEEEAGAGPRSLATEDRLGPGAYSVGYTVLEMRVPDHKGETQTVGVAVWYPTKSQPKPYQYQIAQNQLNSHLALDAKPASGAFPLVIYSHAATGSGLNAIFLTERLASEGFVVAAPDYPDEFCAARILGPQPRFKLGQRRKMMEWLEDIRDRQLNKAGKSFRKNLAYRPQQAKKAIDRLLEENRDPKSALNGAIDENRIGAVGHSFGAWTSILIGGADAAFADSRIKAIVALSGPCNDSVYESTELKNIHVPIMFMFGSEEPKVGRASDKVLLYDRANAPKFLLEVAGSDHFTFSGGIRREYRSPSEYLEKDGRRAVIVRYTELFLKYYLYEEREAGKQLQYPSPALVSFTPDFGAGRPSPD